MLSKKLLASILVYMVATPVFAMSASVRSTLAGHSGQAQLSKQTAAAVFNLGSAKTGFSAATLIGKTPISIRVGQTKMLLTPSEQLTAAEFIAAYQVATQGKQTLQINKAGDAIGGSFSVSSALGGIVSGLDIPKGVTLIENVAQSQGLDLSGNLVNAGTIYELSSNALSGTALIVADNIENLPGGVITTVPPAGLFAGSGVSKLNLSLSALGNILNAGIISSSGNLELVAGNAISNTLTSGSTNNSPVMTARNNVGLQSANIVNQGLINAIGGNLSVTSPGNSLNVNNNQGVLSAANNLVLQTGAGGGDLQLTGGTLAAGHIYFTAPQGNISVNAQNIEGGVNLSGGTASVNVNSGTLAIESNNLSGDPTFTNATGNLDLAGVFTTGSTFATGGEYFTALAGGNIYDGTVGIKNYVIDATSATGAGGMITLAAGVTFDSSDNITGASSTGGSVTFTRLSLQTNSNNILVIANSGSANAGDITLNNITTTADGSIKMVSGSKGTVSINSGVNITGGNIDIQTGNLVDFGSIIATATNGNINIQSTGALTLSGNPQNIQINPSGSGTITVTASGANALTLSSYTFTAGPNGWLVLSAPAAGGSVVFPDNAMLYVYGGVYTSVVSPLVTFGQNSGVLAVGASAIDINSGSLAQVVYLPANSQVLLSTNGGQVMIGPYTSANLSFTTANGQTSQLFVNAGNLSAYGSNITVGSGITLSTNENMLFNIVSGTGGTFTDNGTLYSSNYAGNISIGNQSSNLTLAGTPQGIILSGGGAGTVNFNAGGPQGTLFVNSSYSVDGSTQGSLVINASNVNLSAGQTLSAINGSSMTIFTDTLNLGTKSTLSASGSGGLNFDQSGPATMNINVAPGGTATLVSTQGAETSFESNAISFNGKGSQLNASGGTLNAFATNNMTIGSSLTLNSNNNISLSIWNGTLNDNGTIINTAPNGAIGITGGVSLTLAGNPVYIAAVGGGNSTINVTGYNNGVNIASSYIFDAGSLGSVRLTAASGALTLASGKTVTFAGGSQGVLAGAKVIVDPTAVIKTDIPARDLVRKHVVPASSANAPAVKESPTITLPSNLPTAAQIKELIYEWQTTLPVIDNSIDNILRQQKIKQEIEDQLKEKGEELLVMNSCCSPAVTNQIPMDTGNDKPVYTPVAFVPQSVIADTDQLHTASLDAAVVKYTGDTSVCLNAQHHLILKHGETILVATHPLTMHFGKYTVQLKAITIALLSKEHGIFRLSNLYDKQSHSVTFALPCGQVDLAPGHEIILAASNAALEHYLNHDQTARRGFSKVVLQDGHDVATAEASLVSLFRASNVLCALRDSNRAEDRPIANKIMLMAACVMLSTPSHGRYVVLAYDRDR